MNKSILIWIISLSFVLSLTDVDGRPKFKPFVIPDLEQSPDFWKVKPKDIIDLCRHVSVGRSEIIAKTPFGFPVYAVFYGDFSEDAPQTNWSAGNSSTSIMSYLGERHEDSEAKQTILFLAGVHGSEPEGVAAAMNLIKMLETGADFRGKTDSELLELASRYRIIVIPCANMDGRSLSPDHLRGQEYEVFRASSQGTWKDGSLIGWRGSKEYFPLPLEKVSFPGGYPNGDGYNIQHDCTPGDMRTSEASAICKLMSRWRVDIMLNIHSCEYAPSLLEPSIINTPEQIQTGMELCEIVNQALVDAGLRNSVPRISRNVRTLNLTNLTNWCSGGLGLTLECSTYTDNLNNPKVFYSFDQLMEPPFILLKEVMKKGMSKSLSGRPKPGINN